MMTDQKIRVVPAGLLYQVARRNRWTLNPIPLFALNRQGNYRHRQTAIDVANERTANGINAEMIIAAEEDGTFTVLEIGEADYGIWRPIGKPNSADCPPLVSIDDLISENKRDTPND